MIVIIIFIEYNILLLIVIYNENEIFFINTKISKVFIITIEIDEMYYSGLKN